MSRQARVYDADIDALQQRLRDLLAAGDRAGEQDIAGYEAERERVLDLIGNQLRDQRDHDTRMQHLRADMTPHHRHDDDWMTDGYEAAHQAHLNALAHTEASGEDYPIGPDTPRYDDALRHGAELHDTEHAAERRRVENMINTADRHDTAADTAGDTDTAASAARREVVDAARLDHTELGDRDRVLAEAPASQIGGMWFTPDESAPGGVRPLTEAEVRESTDRVRATQADAVDLAAVDRQIQRARDDLLAGNNEGRRPPGDCYTGDFRQALRDGAHPEDLDDVRGDQR